MNDWLNEVAARVLGIELRRIDFLLAFGLVACLTYYWVTTGWQGAILGGLLYVMFWMIAVWML